MWPISRGRLAGFTLIELMITVAIVGILMAVAIPSFVEQMRKGRRSDAMVLLLDAYNRQEQYMLDNSTYSADMTKLGFGASPAISEEGHYLVKVVTPSASCPINRCYELQARPVSGGHQADDKRCAVFSMNFRGQQKALDASSNDTTTECW